MKTLPRASEHLHLAVDPAAPLSLQRQLRQKLVDAIHRGVLRPGQRLPSSRALAQRIGVSRNTVSLAYDALLAEGILNSRARSGIFVAMDVGSNRIGSGRRRATPDSPLSARIVPASGEAGYRTPQHWHRYPFVFVEACVDAELVPATEWGEAIRLAGARHEVLQWQRDGSDIDDAMLLQEVRAKVLPMRGIQAAAEELLVSVSCRHALHLAGALLVRRGTPVVLEHPVDPAFERFARARHAELSLLDPALSQALPDGAVVVTSRRHGLAGGAKFAQRLLARIEAADGVLIEHDVPTAVLDDGRSTPALRAIDQRGRVIHVGSLAPSVSCGEPPGLLVASGDFIERARQLRRQEGAAPAKVMQRAWAYFIGLGHYSAALVRAGRILGERRTALRDALNHYLHDRVRIEALPGASAYRVSLPGNLDALQVTREAATLGVLVEPVRNPDGSQSLYMGVAGIATGRIREGVRHLARLLRGGLAAASQRLEHSSVAPLRGRALRRAMAGISLLYNTVYGEPCTLELAADGSLSGTAGFANEDRDTGLWWVEGDRWFRQWQHWAYGEAAGFAVVIEGDQVRFYSADGVLVDAAVLIRPDRARARLSGS